MCEPILLAWSKKCALIQVQTSYVYEWLNIGTHQIAYGCYSCRSHEQNISGMSRWSVQKEKRKKRKDQSNHDYQPKLMTKSCPSKAPHP